MEIDLRGKNALVCGASKGIGKACAIELSKLGASILALARSSHNLQNTISELDNRFEQNHESVVLDLFDKEKLEEVISKVVARKTIHILINNTGGPKAGKLSDAGINDLMRAFEQHIIASQLLTAKITPGMIHEKYGRIINIISTSAKEPIKGLGVSNTIRGAMANWGKTLAEELGHFDITVNNILPGSTWTERQEELIQYKSELSGKPMKEVKEQILSSIPLRRFGKPREIAYAVAFLASPAASYITGINLPVDGGRTKSL